MCHINLSAPLPPFNVQKSGRNRMWCNDSPGINARVVSLQHPDSILHVAFTGRNSALLVRCHWDKIVELLPAPVYRERFGLS